jgi:adenylate cyclase
VTDLSLRIRELEARVQHLEALRALNAETDNAIEAALRDRLPLEQTLLRVAPLLLGRTGARCAWIRTYDENLELRDFCFGVPAVPSEAADVVHAAVTSDTYRDVTEQGSVVGQRVDVAGESFGAAALWFDGALDDAACDVAQDLLDTWCEELDNYLASIAQSRQKLHILRATSDALKEPVLDDGIRKAIAVLQRSVPFEDMLLVFRQEDDLRGASLNYKIIQNGVLTHDSRTPDDMDVDDFIRTDATEMIRGRSRGLLDRFGIQTFREEVLITGVRDERVLGRVVVTSARGEFNTYDRDLLERFADALRQRVVDFNREWKHLSLCFPADTVRRLLHEEGYVERYLVPREQDVAILYCDISGFTRISEQVLGEPALIGALVNTWSKRVVDIVWETGGVFDKMVGDCIIALWGPPFHELSPAAACQSAADAAERIRDYTRTLNDGVELPALAGMELPIGVATGLNYCPLFVGLFGPDEDYTGFSSGMNNTARLQGVATRDQILCMDAFVAALGNEARFGPEQRAQVKNVAEPLRYRELR